MTKPSPKFYRVAVLLSLLVCAVLFALADVRAREARKSWDHTLDVAIVLVGSSSKPAVAALSARVPALAESLTRELRRYRPSAPPPFHFEVFGPVTTDEPDDADMPRPLSTSLVDGVRFSWQVHARTRHLNAAVGLSKNNYDSIIYVYLAEPKSRDFASVAGLSDRNGRIGLVQVELDETMADTALFVIGHELLHTVGASDRYDENGKTLVPEGLGDPAQQPRFPQTSAEIMARNRVLAPDVEVIPQRLDELRVGQKTAIEIRWQNESPR
jgi:hypothetical protein